MNYFPYCGRTFVCSDSVGITDIRQARSAFAFALNYGQQQCSAYSRANNTYDAAVITEANGDKTRLYDQPLVGFAGRGIFVRPTNIFSPFTVNIPLELMDSMDMAAITFGFRFADIEEVASMAFVTGGGNGQGARSQRIRIFLNNLANSLTSSVLEIYYDLQYWQTNVGTAVGSNVIDLATMTASAGFTTANLTQDGHNIITVLHALPRSFRQINRACAASLQIQYEMAKDSSGNTWLLGTTRNSVLKSKLHPLANTLMAFCGVNEADVRFFRTDSWQQGTAPATLSRSRAYPLTPIPSWPLMGDTYTAGVQNSLNAYANSIQGLGWVGANAVGANVGGFQQPMAGNSYQFFEVATTNTFYGEIPHGATQFMGLAYIKLDNVAGRNQQVGTTIFVDSSNSDFASITFTQFGGGSAGWWYFTGSLDPSFNLPNNGQVNRLKLVLESYKNTYGSRSESTAYWDGIHSILIKFF